MYKTAIAGSMDEKRGIVENHVTECDMLQMNGALFNPRAAVRSCIQPGLYCAAPLFPRESLSPDTAGHTLNGAAHDQSRLQTPSTLESCRSLLLSAVSHHRQEQQTAPWLHRDIRGESATHRARMHFLTLTPAKYE